MSERRHVGNKEWGRKARKDEDAYRGLNNTNRRLAVVEEVAMMDEEWEVSIDRIEGWEEGYRQGEFEREALARANSELRSEVLRLNQLLGLLG